MAWLALGLEGLYMSVTGLNTVFARRRTGTWVFRMGGRRTDWTCGANSADWTERARRARRTLRTDRSHWASRTSRARTASRTRGTLWTRVSFGAARDGAGEQERCKYAHRSSPSSH